ncbi:Acetyl-coenzyme A synthetase 2 [Aduncisulcus paluster]|uniref:acetate--CoA ligase n=1 Tax=Aduncisulcus paluster TaxID=2918883 RepID=A0ABQ5KVM0_9EUKA|nr:Acetyl-coenzyme A synthetase 2 [Aduncisulcus paluster]
MTKNPPSFALELPSKMRYKDFDCDPSLPLNYTGPEFIELLRKSWFDSDKYFLDETAKYFKWLKIDPDAKINACDLSKGIVSWFKGYYTNYCWNALDRHIENGFGDDCALIWEGNEPEDVRKFSYNEMFAHVCQYANLLKKLGVKKGDRVAIYMPMVPEMVMAILACTRIGAIFVNIFSALSAEALQTRIFESESCILITCDEVISGIKHDPTKEKVNIALTTCPSIKHTIVHHLTGIDIESHPTDLSYEEEITKMSPECDYQLVESNDTVFIIYSSGSTGKPKGIMHSMGYPMVAAMGPDYFENLRPGMVTWCSGNPAWIGGLAHAVLGPFLLRVTTFMYAGDFFYPDPSRVFKLIDRHRISMYMTQPTMFRILRAMGDKYVTSSARTSLHTIVTAGEVCSPDLWEYIHKTVCMNGQIQLVHIYGQSEGSCLTHHREISGCKPGGGYVSQPPCLPALMDDAGKEIEGTGEGVLVFQRPWYGLSTGFYKNMEEFKKTYFDPYPGYVCTGDVARRDEDGLYTVIGRVDDVIKTGYAHRIGTGEVESCISMHPAVAEVAAVGCPHPIMGRGLYLFVRLFPQVSAKVTPAMLEKFKKTYFDPYPGYVCTGDVARRDEDGLYTVIGRVDDVIKTGYAHRIGTGEVESCISMHPAVAEVAAVGCPHPIMGRGLYLFVRLFPQVSAKVTPAMLEKFKKDFYGMLVKKIGELAKPSLIQWVDALPKTLSGKMMRRILRAIADGKPKEQWGDMSGVANPEVLDVINKGRLEVTIEEDEEEDEED